jgi:predicted nucleic acid-binding protein
MIDRTIAAVALRRRATLLAHDADLDRVACVMTIEFDEASLRAEQPRLARGHA